MRRETKIIRGSLAVLAIGSLVAFPAIAAQATDAPAAPAAIQAPTAVGQPAPGQPVGLQSPLLSVAASETPAEPGTAGSATRGTTPSGKAAAPAPNKAAPSAPASTPAAPNTAAPESAGATPANSATSPAPVKPTPAAAAAAAVKVSSDKPAVAVGKTLTGAIQGLTVDQVATVALVSTDTSPSKPADLACTVTPATSGAQKKTIRCDVPQSQPKGVYQLKASYKDSAGADLIATSEDVQVYLYDPQISGPTLPVSPGTNTTIKGSGYQPESTVQVSSSSFLITGGEATVDKDGNFTFTLKLSPFTPEGRYTVTVTDPATRDKQQLSVYVLRGNATLQVTQNSGVQGGFSTDVSGDGFSTSDTAYSVDLKLYDASGSSVLATLATGVQVSQSKLPSTKVQVPGKVGPGLYQVSAVAKDSNENDVRLAATWIAVFPTKEVIVTPPTVITQPPVIVTPPKTETPNFIAPLITPAPAPAPAPVSVLPPLAHQLGGTGVVNSFGINTDSTTRIPDLNSSTPSPKPDGGGSLSKDPTPTPSKSSPASPQADAPVTSQAQSSQDIWPLILVGIIAIVLGLILGYFIALAGRRRSEHQ